ncbi:MAG: SIR2 family protein, partial [Candidatus Omnitrophica bacterium]|nr:SIR2 family protein [Candidatus Omnitrophota bacterium]
NFDHGFVNAGGKEIKIDSAPHIGLPKVSTWRNLVHLHGIIDEENDPQGKNLILSSAGFGRAYLTEGWAARFVTELFRNFTVLFVGYSLDDPVIRYLMDAFAADRDSGDPFEEAYAFVPVAGSEEERNTTLEKWEAKHVVPIPYESDQTHSHLHNTLHEWANVHRDGLNSRISLVHKIARNRPGGPLDERISQLVWAISDNDGVCAKAFLNLDPSPPLEWLEHLDAAGLFSHPNENPEDQPGSCIVQARGNCFHPGYGPTIFQLTKWLFHHLADPRLALWVCRKGGHLHPTFDQLLSNELKKTTSLSAEMRQFWQCVLDGRMSANDGYEAAELEDQVKAGAWNPFIRRGVIEALSPLFSIRSIPNSSWFESKDRGIGDIDCEDRELRLYSEVDLRGGTWAVRLIKAISRSKREHEIILSFADEVIHLLDEAIELDELFPGGSLLSITRPCIEKNTDHTFHEPWSLLVDLLWRSFQIQCERSPEKARQFVFRWKEKDHLLFHRLCCQAFTKVDIFPTEDSIAFLLSLERETFWAGGLSRERLNLIGAIGSKLKPEDLDRLVKIVMEGPPRAMFVRNISNDEWNELKDRILWEHLKKLSMSGADLPEDAKTQFDRIEKQYPFWRLREDKDRIGRVIER